LSKVTAVLMGAGSRGRDAFGAYAKDNPDKLKIVALAEPNPIKRNRLADELGIPEAKRFEDWKDLLSVGKIADSAIIAMMDDLHVEPSIEAMKLGYDILLEKPMDRTLEGSMKIALASQEYERKVIVCHVLRYSLFFSKLRELMHSGVIGRIMGIEHKENVGYFHMAHSFVRGNWRNSKETAPIILTKSCHDMDLLYWLIGEKCTYISSFGELSHFKRENMPDGATERCARGCKVEKECPYSAIKIYLGDNIDWPVNVITTDLSHEGRLKALNEGPYGRCVYACDNDVIDHQVVSMTFGKDVMVNFTLSAFTREISRTIRVFGTMGEIRGHFEKNELEVTCFGKEPEVIKIEDPGIGAHNGSDYHMMDAFVEMLSNENYEGTLTSAMDSLESHLMAFAAEESRLNNKVINMEEYRKEKFYGLGR